MQKTLLVLGATGGIGGALTQAALQRGWQVRALARDIDRAKQQWPHRLAPQWLRGDAMCGEDVDSAAEGATVIFHGVNPPAYRHWNKLVLPMIDNTLAAARHHKALIVLPGNMYNYDVTRINSINETTPQQPKTRKGILRKQMEQRLAQAAPQVASIVLRSGDFFGPHCPQSWFSQTMAKPPLLQIQYPGCAGIGHSWAYVPDVAEAMMQLIELPPERRQTYEQLQFQGIWDFDGTQMVKAIRRGLKKPNLPLKPLPWRLLRLLSPFNGFMREISEMEPFWKLPLQLDNQRLLALIGTEPHRPLDEAVRASIDQ